MTEFIAVALAPPPIPRLLLILFIITARCSRTYFLFIFFRSPSEKLNEHAIRQQQGGAQSVHTAATLFQKMCYENKDSLTAGIIVAGWDKEVGPSVYNIPVGGGLFRQPWAIGGTQCN